MMILPWAVGSFIGGILLGLNWSISMAGPNGPVHLQEPQALLSAGGLRGSSSLPEPATAARSNFSSLPALTTTTTRSFGSPGSSDKSSSRHGPARLLLNSSAVPTLTVIGCSKCGSTDVWVHLVKDLQLFTPGAPSGSGGKEIFCLSRRGHKEVQACYDRNFGKPQKGVKTIDGGPTYFHLYDRHTQTEDEYAAVNFALATPDTAILLVLRNPIKALRSQFNWHQGQPDGPHFKKQGEDINEHLAIELKYFDQPETQTLMDGILQEPRSVDVRWIFSRYRRLADGYHKWLASDPALCSKVSKLGISEPPGPNYPIPDVPWCYSWPFIITTLYYPMLLHWRAVAFRPQRVAIVQSEFYYANRSIVDGLFGLSLPQQPGPTREGNANKAEYQPGTVMSTEIRQRLETLYSSHNKYLRGLLEIVQDEGAIVMPAVGHHGAWWEPV